MTATEFWRDLEIRFRALHDEQCRRGGNHVVYAFWSSVGLGPDGGNPWSVSGGSTLDRTKFEWLAQSAAVRLGQSGGPTAVFAWLDRLKAESPRYKGGIRGKFEEPKASKVIETESGLIEFLCLASAELCRKCETAEISSTKGRTTEVEILQAEIPPLASNDFDLPPAQKVGYGPDHFEHDHQYRHVEIGGKPFSLTPDQARVIEILHLAHKSGRPDVPNREILAKLERETSRLRDIFRSRPGAWRALVKRGVGRGMSRLNLPDAPKP
jgi:hypothetical protein